MACKSNTLEPIAIVGTSCRFTGGATSPSKLWDLLCKPRDLSREVPPDRFCAKGFYHKDGQHHGTTNAIKAYWLEEHPRFFDANLFNIHPKEAEGLDPQQRFLLEGVFEAMESAGFPVDQYRGQKIAVYAASMTHDYEALSARDELTVSTYTAVGNSRALLANRISYTFDFRGVSLAIDTACSSSLTALYEAAMNLRQGDSSMACVMGVNLMLTPEQFIAESSLGMLSPSGKCHMWDARADGYARGEGMAVVLVKLLSRAIADGDHIEAVIRGIDCGADGRGRTTGITEPNPAAQTDLIKSTYEKAGLDPNNPSDRCQYFEAHGTGTQVGDPREAKGIYDAFFDNSSSSQPDEKKLLVGSIKTVIGHTEAASGLAGVLKTVWSMKNGVIPPNLHLENINPKVEPYYKHLQIPTVITPWPDPPAGEPRRASVNSFGFGGSNAHAIIESYTPEIHGAFLATRSRSGSVGAAEVLATQPQPGAGPDSERGAGLVPFHLPIVLSAASPKSLHDVVKSYRTYLDQNSVDIHELSWHQYKHRTDHLYRVAFSAATTLEAQAALDSLLKDERVKPIGRYTRSKNTKSPLRILGVFTGQGAQWPTMSASLLQQSSVYRDTIRKLDSVLKTCPHPCSWNLEEEIMADNGASRIGEAAVSQPLCTALQIAMVDFLQSVGINFHTVIGHSSGEIAAAYAAGRLSAEDAIIISYYRGMVAHLAGGPDGQKGGMAAIEMPETEALDFCNDSMFDGRLQVAASNSPASTTISGDLDAIHLALKQLTGKQRHSRALRVDTAYHSKHMTKPAIEYIKLMREHGVRPTSMGNGTTWVSSVSGRRRNNAEDLDCQYWADNMVNQVQFNGAVKYALSHSGDEFDCVIEVGPHPALQSPFTQIATELGYKYPYTCPLNRTKANGLSTSNFLGFIWSKFGPSNINLHSYIRHSPIPNILSSRISNPPPYPFDHSVGYWRTSLAMQQYLFRADAPHELLGVRSREDNQYEMRWRNILRPDQIPWLNHHRFQGQPLLPASAYCIMAFDAAQYLLASRSLSAHWIELRDIEILSGIAIDSDGHGVETYFSLIVMPDAGSSAIAATFNVYSRVADTNATAKVKQDATGTVIIGLQPDPYAHYSATRPSSLYDTLTADPEAFYGMMKGAGLDYSGPFKAITSIERRYKYCSATLGRFHPDDTTTLQISPATLDACFQSSFLSFAAPGDGSLWTSFLPTTIGLVKFNMAALKDKAATDPKGMLTADTHLARFTQPIGASKASISVDLDIFNRTGEREIEVRRLTVRALANTGPREDVEFYLHTVMDVDPTDEIVRLEEGDMDGQDTLLAESCHRISAFYSGDRHLSSIRRMDATDTQDNIETVLLKSEHDDYLNRVNRMGQLNPNLLSTMLPYLEEEARRVSDFRSLAGRIAKQIVHRYPRMNILCLATRRTGLTRSILKGIGESFRSLTIGIGQGRIVKSSTRVQWRDIDIRASLDHQMGSNIPLDMMIIPATSLGSKNIMAVLQNLGRSMRTGGFMILISLHVTMIDSELSRIQSSDAFDHDLTSQHWKQILDVCGFVGKARRCDQTFPAGLVLVRQFQGLSAPHSIPATIRGGGNNNNVIINRLLLVRGVDGGGNHQLVRSLQEQLSPRCNAIAQRSLDGATEADLEGCDAAIVLADLDEPLVMNMTDHRISQLRTLLRPALTVLWVTRDVRAGNPEHAASLGFLRTAAAEVAALRLQVLDLDSGDDNNAPVDTIAEAFTRLAAAVVTGEGGDGNDDNNDNNNNPLMTLEREIYMDDGRRLIPRVVPWKDGNDRINAGRRVVMRPVNTLQRRVELVPHYDDDHTFRGRVLFKLRECSEAMTRVPPSTGRVRIKVDYSSAFPVRLAGGRRRVDENQVTIGYNHRNGYMNGNNSGNSNSVVSAYVCAGLDMMTGKRVIALSATNASYITCPSSQVMALSPAMIALDLVTVLHRFIRCVAALRSVANTASFDAPIVLVDPEVEFLRLLLEFVAPGREVIVLYVCSGENDETPYDTLQASDQPSRFTIVPMHPPITASDVTRDVPRNCTVFNFLPFNHDLLPAGHDLSHYISMLTPSHCTVYTRLDMTDGQARMREEDYARVQLSCQMALTATLKAEVKDRRAARDIPTATVSEIQLRRNPEPFQIVDWKRERDTVMTVDHRPHGQLVFPDKTYYLFGMTRDLGQSICRLLVENGARSVVLASRNADLLPRWVTELNNAHMADIRIERADVTDRGSLEQLREDAERTMPTKVGGVVNGAMVLEDQTLVRMTAAAWDRVMRPKTVGSANLDAVFPDRDVDFFIMTSSFAAVGGHAGQAGYAAANMYMNGLAADRRRRGLAASALNIGVLYGLGFLHRERDHLYAGLEREGYPPVSERQLHHMFLEAIVAGRPDPRPHRRRRSRNPGDITTGLRRFRRDAPNPLHWHRDPRFGHLAMHDDDGSDVDGAVTAPTTTAAAQKKEESLREKIADLDDENAIADLVAVALVRRLHALLGLPDGAVDSQRSPMELGLDSMNATELRTWFSTNLNTHLPVMKILDSPSIQKLCLDAAEQFLATRAEKGKAITGRTKQ